MFQNKIARSTFIALLMILIFGTSLALYFKLNLFITTLLFWGASAAYLSWQNKQLIKQTLLFVLCVEASIGVTVDYIAYSNHAWQTPHTIFADKFFNLVPIENPLWVFLYFYTVIMLFESLLQSKRKPQIRKQFFGVTALLTVVSVVIHQHMSFFTSIHYFYLISGVILFLIPSLILLFKYAKGRQLLLKTTLCMLPLALANEVVALRLNHWNFPGVHQYIARLGIFGVSIPYEECLFFILIGPLGILSYYVYFVRRSNVPAER